MRYGVAGTFIDEIGSNQSRYEGGEVKRIVRLLVLIGWDVKSWRHIVVEIRTFIGGNETTVTLEGTVDIVEVLVPAAFPLLSRRKFGVVPFEVPCLARHDASLERLVRSQMLAERRRRSRFGHERQGDSALLPLRSHQPVRFNADGLGDAFGALRGLGMRSGQEGPTCVTRSGRAVGCPGRVLRSGGAGLSILRPSRRLMPAGYGGIGGIPTIGVGRSSPAALDGSRIDTGASPPPPALCRSELGGAEGDAEVLAPQDHARPRGGVRASG